MAVPVSSIIVEELKALHVTDEDGCGELYQQIVNTVLNKVGIALLNAETRMLDEDTKRLNKDTAERQTKFLKDHAVGNH